MSRKGHDAVNRPDDAKKGDNQIQALDFLRLIPEVIRGIDEGGGLFNPFAQRSEAKNSVVAANCQRFAAIDDEYSKLLADA